MTMPDEAKTPEEQEEQACHEEVLVAIMDIKDILTKHAAMDTTC